MVGCCGQMGFIFPSFLLLFFFSNTVLGGNLLIFGFPGFSAYQWDYMPGFLCLCGAFGMGFVLSLTSIYLFTEPTLLLSCAASVDLMFEKCFSLLGILDAFHDDCLMYGML